MQRYFQASLTTDTQAAAAYHLIEKGADCVLPPNCHKIHPPEPKRFILYACEN
jgi:hypothetical protein